MATLEQINQVVEQESKFVEGVLAEMGQVVVGQRAILERLLIGVLTGGHILIEGVPGLAKTLIINTLGKVLNLGFSRIQFTPDLLPADLIGTMVYYQQEQAFKPKLGPIFSNLVLADEINRAPAKVQSALLEAMAEKQVTIGEQTYKMDDPFLVFATQNPVDQEGTYQLPEAQMDRFLMKLIIGYPSKEDEKIILERMTGAEMPTAKSVMEGTDIARIRKIISEIYVDEKVKMYVLDLIHASRDPEAYQLSNLSPLIDFGASPRASIALISSAKAHAFLRHRGYVTPDDIKAVGRDVLRHRIIPSFEAEAEEVDSQAIVDRLFSEIEVP